MAKIKHVLVIDGKQTYAPEIQQLVNEVFSPSTQLDFISTPAHARRYLAEDAQGENNQRLIVIDPHFLADDGPQLVKEFMDAFRERMVVYSVNDAMVAQAKGVSLRAASKKHDIGCLKDILEDIRYQ